MSSQSAGCATRANTKERGRKKVFLTLSRFSFFLRQFSSRPVAGTYADAAYLNFQRKGWPATTGIRVEH